MTMTRETIQPLLDKMTFEVINGEMDKPLAEEIGRALLATMTELEQVKGERDYAVEVADRDHARAEAAETALAAMTARCDQMTSAWGKDAVKVEELTARNEALVGLVGRAQHIVPGFCPNWHKDARAALRTNATDASEGER